MKKNTNLYIFIGIFTFAFLLYSNTLSHGYVLDDMIVTTDNPLVKKGFGGIKEIINHGYFYANTGRNDESYRPLSMVMIAIETQFFGLNTTVNHFFNIFFYALSCAFLFLLLKLFFKKQNFLIPLFITLLFVAHPIHTEVVANIKSRDEIMQFFFIVLSLRFLLKGYSLLSSGDWQKKSQKEAKNKKSKAKSQQANAKSQKLIAKGFFLTSYIFYFFALMSKEIAITFLAVIPLMLYFFTDLKLKKIVISTLPYFVVFAIYFIVRISVLDSITFDNEITLYQNSLIAANNFSEFIGTNLFIHLKYLLLLIFPHPLNWDYSYNQIPIISIINYKSIISIIVFVGTLVYAIIGFKKKSPISFAIFYYLITISIVSNFVVKIASTMGERFIFTSSLGFVIILVVILSYIFKIKKTDIFNNIPIYIIIGILLLLYSYKTVARNKDWESNLTLYEAGVIISPNSARAHIAMADVYNRQLKEAKTKSEADILLAKLINEYETSIKIYPENPHVYYSYGYMYYTINQKDKALEQFEKGIIIDSLHVDMLNYIGIIYTQKNDFEKGEIYFLKVLSVEPDYVHALNNLSFIYTEQKEYQKAINLQNKIIEIGKATKATYTQIENLKKKL